MENNKTIKERQAKDRQKTLEVLKEMPIIEVACKKAGISRATYYRWRNEDISFLKQCEESLSQGIEFINDMSESQLITLIKEKKMPAITMWLKHNNPRYGGKAKPHSPQSLGIELSPEKEKIIAEALRLSSNIKYYGTG